MHKMKQKEINRILREYKDMFDALEEYDRTGELPFQRKRIDLILPVKTINKLKRIKKKTGKPVSRIVEEKIENEI